MDEICAKLSSTIKSAAQGRYAVFYEDELLEAMPENFKNRETLEAALKNLAADGCIDVKYARGAAFCIAHIKDFEVRDMCPQTQPQDLCEEKVIAKKTGRAAYILFAVCAVLGGALGAFLGALAGAAI